MAEIKNFSNDKGESEKKEKGFRTKSSRLRLVKSEDEYTFQEKIHRHRMGFVYRVLLSVLVCMAIVAIIALRYLNKEYDSYDIISTVDTEWVSGTTTLELGKGLLVYSKDGAHCTDMKGNVLWEQTYEMQSPIVSVCEDVAAIGDYNGRNIYLVNAEKQLGTITTNLPIRSLTVAANGVVAAVLDDTTVTWIYVYDTAGNELLYFRTTMRDTGYPISLSLSPNALMCAVSYLYVDAGSVKSSVAFYNFDEYGKNQIDNLVGGYDYPDTIVPYVQFMDNTHCFAVGDDSIMFYSGTQKQELTATYYFDYEVRGVYHNTNYVAMVYYNSLGSSRYLLELYDSKGNRLTSEELDMDYTDIVFDGNTYIIYGDEDCLIRTIQGRTKYDGSFKESVRLLIPGSGKYRYYLLTQDGIQIIQMR